MGVHKNSINVATSSGSVKDTTTESGNQATGFSSGFGRQTNTVFGTFPNQNNQQYTMNNNSAAFGSQNIFGNNTFHNHGFFQPHNFGFGCTMSQQITNICFTGFGEPKTNYCFANANAILKKITLVFEHPDIIFGSSIFRKPDTIVEIEAHLINNRTWILNNKDFSFGIGHIEKYNSTFIMKSPHPIKFLVKVKQPGLSFNNTMSSPMNYGNRKITLTFQSDQPEYLQNANVLRPSETIVEIPLPIIKYDPMWTSSNEDFMFSVGPSGSSNSFEVETSKNVVFKIRFVESGKQIFGNRQTRNGSVFFDQGRQMNAFATTSGPLFGGHAPSAFGASQTFGSSIAENNSLSSNQTQPMNFNQTINGSLFGKLSNNSGFGANQSFGNSATDTASTGTEKVDKRFKRFPNTVGSLFGQINNSRQKIGTENIGESVFLGHGLADNTNIFPTTCNQPSIGSTNGETFGFTTNQSLFPNATTTSIDEVFSVQDREKNYQPTFGTDLFANYLTKTNCITAMNEYANTSLEELRLQNYLKTSCEPSKQNNMATAPCETEETANLNKNNFTGYSPTQNKIRNTNQAFFDQLHQLIPYLNAGSFCKCIRSCNAAKNQNNNSALANSQPRTNSDSLDHLYVNTQKPRLNDNITIDEFYQDVFKYLEYIQKQYRHLESTLNNKNANNIPEEHSNKPAADKANEMSNKSFDQNTQKSPVSVFGCSTYSAANTELNESISSINRGSDDDAPTVEKVSGASNTITPSTSKSLEPSSGIEQNLSNDSFPIVITSENSDDAAKIIETSKTEEDHSNKSESNKNPTPNGTSLFGDSTYYTVNTSSSSNPGSKNNASTEVKVPNIFAYSAFSDVETTVSSCSTTTGNTNNNKKVEPSKSLLFGSGINNNIALSKAQPLNFSFCITDKATDAAKKKETNNALDDLTIPFKFNICQKSTTGNETAQTVTSSNPFFSTKDTSSGGTVGEKSTGFFSSTLPSCKPIKLFTGPILSTKDTTSSSTVGEKSTLSAPGFFSITCPSSKPDNSMTGSIFSTKDITSSSTLGGKSMSLFSVMSDKTLTAPIFSTKDTSSNSTVGEKSTCFLPLTLASSKPDNSTTGSIFSTSSSTVNVQNTNADNNIGEIESNARKIIDLSNSDVAESKTNDSSTKESFQNDSDNVGGSSGGINIVKAVNSLKSIISNDNTTQGSSSEEKKIASTQQKHEPMDVQGCFVSSEAFKMRKISDILADINEGEVKSKDSDTDSDISNYSLISNRSLNEDDRKNVSYIQTEEHPTGIVMTYGYYISPSLEELKSQITEDGACVVPKFTIGRKGYGSVCFNKEINVAGLNVNDIVHFRNKEIIIYPNDDIKPEIVDDLKKCDVLVTLEQVWPHDETNHGPIKDPQHLDKIKYEDKLRSVCHKNDVHFVDYRPETGSWLFKMKQFTKNNINCWDVEDEDNIDNKNITGILKIM